MKIFKKNKMFFNFIPSGILIGGQYGVIFQRIIPYSQSIYFHKKNKFFFNLKSNLQLFKNLIILFSKTLQLGCFLEVLINGVGYKCWRFYENDLLLNLGYSHFIHYKNQFNIFFRLTRYSIKCFSLDNFLLGLFVSNLISLRKLDVYKGKGLRLITSNITLKIGKQR